VRERNTDTDDRVTIEPVTPERWDDFAALFERRGPRGGTPATSWCWCMWWRERTHDAARNRAVMAQIVAEGREPGLLAYLDGEPVGWVAIAPRSEYGQLLRSRTLKPNDPAESGVWAIACFYVYPSAKRRGVARRLLHAAVAHARSRGATAVEGYPGRALAGTSSTDFMGAEPWFLAEGFRAARKAGSKHVMRLECGGA
jgi:GNAT superfamily N-acetyltransferase